MFSIPFRKTALAVVALGVVSSAAPAAPIVVPAGLSPGDQYRLVFVTSTITDATSPDIAYYNSFVTAAANTQTALAALGTTWTAIASTPAADAQMNSDTTQDSVNSFVPIFRLDGELVAESVFVFWYGARLEPIDLDQSGALRDTPVWTGTSSDGTDNFNGPLGDPSPIFGFSGSQLSTGFFQNYADAEKDYFFFICNLGGPRGPGTRARNPRCSGLRAAGPSSVAAAAGCPAALFRASSSRVILTRPPPLPSDRSTRLSPIPPNRAGTNTHRHPPDSPAAAGTAKHRPCRARRRRRGARASPSMAASSRR